MATTTMRIDTETHALFVELAAASGTSLMRTAREAAEALQRQRFSTTVADEYAALRRDQEAWDDYTAEAETSSVADGLR